MAEVIIMPKLGFNMSEGKLVKWYKSENDEVKKGENLFSIETDKTNMDIEATSDGVVRKLLIGEGDSIPVTLPIAIIGRSDEDVEKILAGALADLNGSGSVEVANEEAPVKEEVKEENKKSKENKSTGEKGKIKISPRAKKLAESNGIDYSQGDIEGTGFDGGICEKDIIEFMENSKVRISPLAKKIAEQENVDIDSITGSGYDGKIMKKDILEAIEKQASEKAKSAIAVVDSKEDAQVSADGKEILESVPYAGVRKIIGERLTESKNQSPHIYFTQAVNLEALLALRGQVNKAQDQKTSVTDFITKACIMALKKYPDVNSSLIGDTIVKYKTVNLGIAVAAPTGLIVPNIKNSENMSVVEIAKASSGLFAKAREGRLTPAEYTGGTFTISNLGMFGIENFTAIINPPEAAILAVSGTKDKAVVVEKENGEKVLEIKPVMNIQLSVDHRTIDGLLAAQFVTEVKNYLENPMSLMV